ncbi:uncharacterized protein LOC143444357 [Clavelina lepadiformis]|uniref:uncharacterized protein LOC143444357 n=1 Tax=Clavelina lepadiformis TaxID=159417 RepID=UPI004041272B
MLARKRKEEIQMAALSLQDYLTYFLLKNDTNESRNDQDKVGHPNHSLLMATVYKLDKAGAEHVIYSSRIVGGKTADPVTQFVFDMTGKTGNVSNGGSLVRSSSLMDINGECESQLPANSSVTIDILASRSPSNVGADELQRLLEHCKKNSIKANIQFTFAHPFSWDNKYNKEGIQRLHQKGIKLKPLSFQQGLNMMMSDIQDTLESLDEMETCRGTVFINYHMLKRAIVKFRDAIMLKSDFYHQDNDEKLREILGYQNGLPSYKKIQTEPAAFSLMTYRDFFLLQNTEQIWAKVKLSLTKLKNGVTQEEPLYDVVFTAPEPKKEKRNKNNLVKNPLDKQSLVAFTDKLWKLVGDNVTLKELTNHDEIIINLGTVISEYPDRMGWHEALETLHRHLADKLEDMKMSTVKVESVVRYAMNISDGMSPATSGRSTPSKGQSSKVDRGFTTECMHIQDILFDMLEDLEDNMVHLGTIDFGRGANIKVDKAMVSSGLGLLNKATTIRTLDGEVYSMNSDFTDQYSDDMNHS